MKNIWIFNHYVVPPTIDSQHRHNIFAEKLKSKGYNVTVFLSSQIHNSTINLIENEEAYQIEIINNVRYIAIKTRSYNESGIKRVFNMIDFYKGLVKYSKVNKKNEAPDIIYASSVHPLTLLAGLKVAKIFSVKCVCEVRDLWPLTLIKMGRINEKSIFSKVLYKMEKYIYKKADKLIFTMSGGKQYIIDQGWSKQIDINKVYHINNGVDLKKYNKYKENYKYEDIKEGTFKVTYTGSIGQANMVDTIIKAAEIIDKETPNNITFEIFGEGLKRKELEDYVKNNKIKNVNFHGRVTSEYIPSILAKSKINVITGKDSDLYKYGFSQNKFFTYLASGKPMISNRKVHDILEKSNSGTIVEPESPRSLSEGILNIYNMSKSEYHQFCINAYDLAQEYDYEILTNKLEEVLLE